MAKYFVARKVHDVHMTVPPEPYRCYSTKGLSIPRKNDLTWTKSGGYRFHNEGAIWTGDDIIKGRNFAKAANKKRAR